MSEFYRSLTPTEDLEPGEDVTISLVADRAVYWRENMVMAVLAVMIGMGALWAIGNPHIWTGAVGGLAAIAVRAFYLASDELKTRWDLTNKRLLGPQGRVIRLENIAKLNTIFSAVQVVTISGDKHLIKYQTNREATIAHIQKAKELAR